MGKPCQIRCIAERGAFDEEFVVRFPIVHSNGDIGEAKCLAYGESVDLKGDLKEADEVDAMLLAYRVDQQGDFVAVILPQPTFENGPSVVVRRSDLSKTVVGEGK